MSASRTGGPRASSSARRSEEHTSELQSQFHLVCRLLLEKKAGEGNKDEEPRTSAPPPLFTRQGHETPSKTTPPTGTILFLNERGATDISPLPPPVALRP